MKESDATSEDWQNSLQPGAPWVDTATNGGGLTTLSDGKNDNIDMEVEGKLTYSGEMPTVDRVEHLSARDPPGQLLGDSGHFSGPFNRNCAPAQAPKCANTSYDHLPYGQLHALCEKRGYHKEETTAVLKT